MTTKYIPAPVPLDVLAVPEYLSRELRRLARFVDAIAAESGVSDHGGLSGLTDDDHAQYILVNGTRGFTGTQSTQHLTPSAHNTYDLGTTSTRYRQLHAVTTRVVAGTSGTATTSNNGSIWGGFTQQTGSGTAVLNASPAFSTTSCAVAGGARAIGNGASASISGLGIASFSFGDCVATAAGTATMLAGGLGGCLAFGSVVAAGSTAILRATEAGSFALGYCQAGGATTTVQASAFGSIVFGAAAGGSATTTLESSGIGSTAFGYAEDGTLTASGYGANASGYSSGTLLASGDGAIAIGRVEASRTLQATGTGSGAFGHANTANIEATAANAFQFGQGSNAQADSVKIGTAGLRLKGTTGAPGTPVNGDIYMGSTGNAFVIVRSNGKNVQINTGAAGWTVGSYATRRSFSGLTPTTTEVLELLETLVEELQAANLIN